MKAVCRLPQVFEHMNEIEDEHDIYTKMLELILMPIDPHHPRALLFGITPMHLLKQLLGDLCAG
jgi:hypothetical protein